MTMQGHRPGGRAAGLKEGGAAAPRQGLTKPTPKEAARIGEHDAEVARGEREAARQRKVFEARREELLAAHPGRHIAVCAGEAFAGDSAREVMRMAMRAHPGRASFFYSPDLTIADP